MKIDLLKNFISATVLAALLPIGLASSRAASAPSILAADCPVIEHAQPSRVAWVEEKRHKLRHAYWLLEQSDRDYKGHRTKAMEEIRRAGEIMGLDLHGEGYGGEHQRWSDARLREAKQLLVDVVDARHQREHEHIWKAIKQIDKALAVR